MEGEERYECLTHVAKAASTLSHSNAIPERGFSFVLYWTMSSYCLERILLLHCLLSKTLSYFFGFETSVPIRPTKDLTAAGKAHSEYQLYLEEQRRQKAAELNKAVELEKELEDKRQLKNINGSLIKQLREEEQAELNKNMSKPWQRNS